MKKEIHVKKFIDREEDFGLLGETRKRKGDGMKKNMQGDARGMRNRFNSKLKTKMFTSKTDLVEYVNSIGDMGNKINIFKIEDELYKVEVVEMLPRYKKENL